jgi:hypothetical protein
MAGKVISLPVSTRPDLALRIGGTIVGAALAIATAVWEAVLTPWYVEWSGHLVRMPAAPILAIVGNIGIFWFTRRVTGRIGLALLPGLAWLAVMIPAGNLTGGGDLLIEGTWVGFATILLGVLAWAVAAYRAMLAPRPPATDSVDWMPPAPTASPANSRAKPAAPVVGAKPGRPGKAPTKGKRG